jgi:hypothetical protein
VHAQELHYPHNKKRITGAVDVTANKRAMCEQLQSTLAKEYALELS